MNKLFIVFILSFISYAQINEKNDKPSQITGIINPDGRTIVERFNPPAGYERINVAENSFYYYLRYLPLKHNNAKVHLYNGKIKTNNVYDAVVDLDIGNKNLHQCADAIIRLRAEYLFEQKQYDQIHFNFTNGFRADYSEWMKGKRIIINGNKTSWQQKTNASNTYSDLWNYLETVFTYAGTLSLSKELEPTNFRDLNIGDVFIQGGSPGHAIILVDLAINKKNNKKVFLLAQSYMPAQEIQILKNLNDETISPWYSEDFVDDLYTPEWSFKKRDLKRFK